MDVTFTLWDAETGGNQLGGAGFSDTDSVTPNADGIYDTLIGDDGGPAIPGAVFGNDSVWLNVNVNVDGEDLSPRTRLTPVGAALHADTAGDADTVDGVEGADIISNTNAIAAIDASGIADNATSISALMALIADLQNHTHETPTPTPTPTPDPRWNQVGEDIDGEAAGDYSGSSVSLSSDGSVMEIGAYGNDDNGPSSGHVRVYQYDGSIWNQLGDDIDGEAASDYSGRSVSLSSDGSLVAIGAQDNDGNGDNSGHVRVYKFQ